MSINIQAATAHKAVATRRAQALPSPETRELERKWRRWTRSAISGAKKRQAERGERGVAVTMTSDGLMAKLRAASFRCVLSGAEFPQRRWRTVRSDHFNGRTHRPRRPLQR